MLIAVVVVVAVLIVIGTAGQVRTASGPFRRSVDRSYAAMAGPLGRHSAAVGADLARALVSAPTLERGALLDDLDAVVTDTAQLSARFTTITPPEPHGEAGAHCQTAITARAVGAGRVRAAVSALLGGRTGGPASPQPATVQALTGAGGLFVATDTDWRLCRQELAAGPGSARLPSSVWVTDPQLWTATSLSSLVAAMAVSPTLAVHHNLAIGADSVATMPASVAVSAGAAVIPPTASLAVRIVVENGGNVDERDVTATVTATPVTPAGAPASTTAPPSPAGTSQRAARPLELVRAGTTVAVTPPAVRVDPGSRYSVVVSISSAASTAAAASVTLPVVIAPRASATELLTSGSPSRTGHRVVFTATVTAAGTTAAPTGTVAFSDDGAPLAGCTAVPLSSGQATCPVVYRTPAVHAVTATYAGTSGLAGSTSALVVQSVRGPARTSPPSTTVAPG